ncbi:WD40 repeat domain-containing protein, partial [archaeon]
PDGSRIVSGSWDKTIKIWDASSGECVQTLRGHDDSVTSVCISPDGSRIVSGSGDKTIKIWDASSGECVQTLRGHDAYVTSVCISPDGSRIVSGSDDETIKIWDASSGCCIESRGDHSQPCLDSLQTTEPFPEHFDYRSLTKVCGNVTTVVSLQGIIAVGTMGGQVYIFQVC